MIYTEVSTKEGLGMMWHSEQSGCGGIFWPSEHRWKETQSACVEMDRTFKHLKICINFF